MTERGITLCGIKLRTLCMIIGYMHLVSSILDIFGHVLTVGIITDGFQCDVDGRSLKEISHLRFLEPILLIANLGTHGFYPFPHIIKNQYNTYVEYMAVTNTTPRCYPGVLHVYIVDVLNFLINLIWLQFVIGYVKALHKRDHESMRMFVSLSIVKLVMQVMYLGYYPLSFEGMLDFQAYWVLKIMDIVIAFYLLMIIKRYKNALKEEKEEKEASKLHVVEKPPSYFECLVGTVPPEPAVDENRQKNDTVFLVEDTKREMHV